MLASLKRLDAPRTCNCCSHISVKSLSRASLFVCTRQPASRQTKCNSAGTQSFVMANCIAASSAADETNKSCKPKVVLRPCLLGSGVGMTRQAGELVAVAHPQHKAGYKNPMAYGAKPKLSAEVTSRYFVKMVRAAADSTCEKKVLMPYRPDAPRNRPKEILSNIPGKRYGTHPTSSEHYKGESQLKLSDADPESRKPWKTTNMVFQTSAQVTDVVGLANAGISSNIAKRMHKKQGIHSP